jgi:hypothetical protein
LRLSALAALVCGLYVSAKFSFCILQAFVMSVEANPMGGLANHQAQAPAVSPKAALPVHLETIHPANLHALSQSAGIPVRP